MPVAIEAAGLNEDYWGPLDYHEEQQRLLASHCRFTFTAKGRRGGGTEIHKRKVITWAIRYGHTRPRFLILVCLPTARQARDTWWKDLKAMIPYELMAKPPNETFMEITLVNGCVIACTGVENPMRIDGAKPDVIVLDEFGDMKSHVFDRHASIAVGTKGRNGWVWCNGVPRGAHFARLYNQALQADMTQMEAYNWPSSDILDAEQIAEAKKRHDPLTYDAEFNARFQALKGRCYHTYKPGIHAVRDLRYLPERPIMLCLDFGVDPSVALVAQEQVWMGRPDPQLKIRKGEVFTAVLWESFMETSGSTVLTMENFVDTWENHRGGVEIYGDATGGNQHSSSGPMTNWKQVEQAVSRVRHWKVKKRWNKNRVNPSVVNRVLATNAHFMNADKEVRTLVSQNCPNFMNDLDLTQRIPGGKGEPLKDPKDPDTNKLTHLTDAFGYMVEKKHGHRYGLHVAA